MKHNTLYRILFAGCLALLFLFVTACQQESDDVNPAEGRGKILLSLTGAGLYTELETRAEGTVTDLSQYTFTISGTSISGAAVTDLAVSVDDNGLAEVSAGTYTLTADNAAEANKNSGRPYYKGTSESFTIDVNETKAVSIALGKPQNARIRMALDASFTALYENPVVTLSDANRSVTLTSTAQECYFIVPVSGALAYTITADALADTHVTDMTAATGYVEIQAGCNTTITLKAQPASGIIIPFVSGEYNQTFD